MDKLKSEELAELNRYFGAQPQVVTKLPPIKNVRDFAEVHVKKSDGTYDRYKMIEGKWVPQSSVGPIGPAGPTGPAGSPGTPGTPGADGANAYVYIAYASDASGTGFTMTFNAALDYIAILSTNTEIVSPVVGDFAGLWKNYKGATGPGVPTGGTTGQALVKNSNTDYDTIWATIVAVALASVTFTSLGLMDIEPLGNFAPVVTLGSS